MKVFLFIGHFTFFSERRPEVATCTYLPFFLYHYVPIPSLPHNKGPLPMLSGIPAPRPYPGPCWTWLAVNWPCRAVRGVGHLTGQASHLGLLLAGLGVDGVRFHLPRNLLGFHSLFWFFDLLFLCFLKRYFIEVCMTYKKWTHVMYTTWLGLGDKYTSVEPLTKVVKSYIPSKKFPLNAFLLKNYFFSFVILPKICFS